jgi:hypothetical protein
VERFAAVAVIEPTRNARVASPKRLDFAVIRITCPRYSLYRPTGTFAMTDRRYLKRNR